MKILTSVRDGFRLAEEDLALRGPGEFFGLRQHGLPDLKLANLIRDAGEIESAREAAQDLLKIDPLLTAPEHEDLKRVYGQMYGEREKLGLSG